MSEEFSEIQPGAPETCQCGAASTSGCCVDFARSAFLSLQLVARRQSGICPAMVLHLHSTVYCDLALFLYLYRLDHSKTINLTA